MVIPVQVPENVQDFRARRRAISDLLYNAQTNDYCNERGFKQKLIVELYKLGYYRSNETIYETKGK